MDTAQQKQPVALPPELPKRVKQPSIDLNAYDRRAKATDKFRELEALVANEDEERKALQKSIDDLAKASAAAPDDADIKNELARVKARIEALPEAYKEARESLATARRELDALGGPIPTEAERSARRIIDTPAPVVEKAGTDAEQPKRSKAIADSLKRFDDLPKRARTQAAKIADKDAPEQVVLAELEQLFRRQ